MNSRGATAARVRLAAALFVVVMGLLGHGGRVLAGVDSAADSWHVRELPLSGVWYDDWLEAGRLAPFDRGLLVPGAYHRIYMAYVVPGREYLLGLRVRAEAGKRVRVTVFDRWPFEDKARRYELPTGPVVRTGGHGVEYRWRIGISPRSSGNRLFVAVTAEAPAGREYAGVWHGIYLVDSPRRPMNLIGQGITYLRGPMDLVLADGETDRRIVFVEPPVYRAPRAVKGGWGWGWNLVRNGDFQQGLDGWELVSSVGHDAAVRHVAIGEGGLRIRGGEDVAWFGVQQRMQRDVAEALSLLLSITLRIDRQGDETVGAAGVPLRITVCYLDSSDDAHCGREGYRKVFVLSSGSTPDTDRVRTPEGEWTVFEDDLSRLVPPPAIIRSVRIEGGAARGLVAWVRSLSIVAD